MGQRIRVMSFNLASGAGESWVDYRLRLHTEVINETDPDVVFFQEVDRLTGRSGRVDQVEILRQATRLKNWAFQGWDYDGGRYGTAVGTKLPGRTLPGLTVTSNLPRPVPFYRRNTDRTNIATFQATVYGLPVALSSVHYPWDGVGELPDLPENHFWHQTKASEALLAQFAQRGGVDTVIGGDFNAGAHAPSLKVLQRTFSHGWQYLPAGQRGSQNGSIDHIFNAGTNIYMNDANQLAGARHGQKFTDHSVIMATMIVEPPFEFLFREHSRWVAAHADTYAACYPTTDQRTISEPYLLNSNVVLFRKGTVTFRDVPAKEQPADDSRTRFTAAHDWARAHGFQHGFPSFTAATRSAGEVWGTLLVANGIGRFTDVLCRDLGLSEPPFATPMVAWFAGADRWAQANGFAAGMPTGHAVLGPNGYVCGVFGFPATAVDRRDLPWPGS